MSAIKNIPQLFLRIALSLGFLFPVMDRLGLLGTPDSGKAAWGDWAHFVTYTHSLMPFLSRPLANWAALLASFAECLLALGLLAGYKTKWMGLGSAAITLFFALPMMIFLGISAPFKYPVFVFTGAGLLLSVQDTFKWSIDALLQKNSSDPKTEQ